MVRAAFTLIELIFAIVIIAISVISLPMMSQINAKGVEGNMVQEAIFAAATELNGAVTAHWDDNSIEVGMPDSSARVIETALNMCDNDNNSSTFRQMPGHINQPYHRRCLDSSLTTPADASVDVNATSLNDIAHGYTDIFTSSTVDEDGYKKVYRSAITITRPVNFGGVNSNNMKLISSSITDNGNVITMLRTYSANIGEVDYYKRSY